MTMTGRIDSLTYVADRAKDRVTADRVADRGAERALDRERAVPAPEPNVSTDDAAAPAAGVAGVGVVGVFIALGSNLGDRERHIREGLATLESDGAARVLRCSSLHETEPVGGPPGQGRYLNAVAELWTLCSPHALLDALLAIEARHGRRREERHAARTLDLDLLLYGERVIRDARLEVPHPRMWEREFVLAPLREIADASRLARLRARLNGNAE
ncbi:MAG: hypothetical protein CHACPFDD_03867 [Phycisphaerae bacterium]|nr:hypothetical protein [Phycisphaerae bacterium]